jgi:hypothetical protein
LQTLEKTLKKEQMLSQLTFQPKIKSLKERVNTDGSALHMVKGYVVSFLFIHLLLTKRKMYQDLLNIE